MVTAPQPHPSPSLTTRPRFLSHTHSHSHNSLLTTHSLTLTLTGALQNRGTRTRENHLAFETLLTAIIPDLSDEHGLIHFLADLLEVDRKAVRRCMHRSRNTYGFHGFVSVLHLPRQIRFALHCPPLTCVRRAPHMHARAYH